MKKNILGLALAFLGLLGTANRGYAGTAAAEGTPFNIIGYIQKFTLFTAADMGTFCPGTPPALAGAKMVVNGIEVIIPCNTIVTMPATYLTPKDIFDMNPKAVAGESGLAIDDTQPPLASFEAALDGNIVTVAGGPRYIAGLVHISQQSLNNGSGYITAIDLDGTLHVGSRIPPVAAAPGAAPDALVRINDSGDDAALNASPPLPTVTPGDGRFGLRTSVLRAGAALLVQDGRFTADTTNPTIHAQTGYPMCIPRSGTDSQCPAANRPIGGGGVPLSAFVMDTLPITLTVPVTRTILPCGGCDPTKQAPLMIGDYINYSGTLATGHPSDPPNTRYISAHTISAWLGIYTKPGAPVAYLTQEVSLIGTGTATTDLVPNPLGGGPIPQEAAPRTIKVVGFTTDPSRTITVTTNGVDSTGTPVPITVGTVPTEAIPFGRFRFIITKLGVGRKGTLPSAGPPVFNVASPVKELRVSVPTAITPGVANGLTSGIFDAPINEFIFAETTVFGDPLVPANFHRFCHLAVGSGPLGTRGLIGGPNVGQLAPWPGAGGPASFGPPSPVPNPPICP